MLALAVLAALVPALLAGCGMSSPLSTPVDWWHQLEGGPIADLRPPPPGASDPFPNLGEIPKRPVPTNAATRQDIADALSADRTLAERDAAMAPIVPSAPPAPAKVNPAAAAPTAPAQGSQAAQADQAGGGITASLDAASAPPAPPRPGQPAPPPAGVTDALLGAPPAPAAPTAPVPDGPLPAFAAQPPPAPDLPGLQIPRQPAPAPVAMSPPPQPSPAPANGPDAVGVGFATGSSVLPSAVLAPLRGFAAARGRRILLITGRGEAVSSDPNMQAAALALGLDRARAIAAALTASGTPAGAIRLGAEAAGRGAYVRLVD